MKQKKESVDGHVGAKCLDYGVWNTGRRVCVMTHKYPFSFLRHVYLSLKSRDMMMTNLTSLDSLL